MRAIFFSFRFPRRDTGDAEIQAHLPIIQIYQTLLLVVTSRCGQNVALLVKSVAGILAFPVLSTPCLCKSSSSIKCITCDERWVWLLRVYRSDMTFTVDWALRNSSIWVQNKCHSSVRFSSVPWPTWSSGGHEGRFRRDPLPVFSAGGHCEQLWHGQWRPVFDVVHPAVPLPTTASPNLQGIYLNIPISRVGKVWKWTADKSGNTDRDLWQSPVSWLKEWTFALWPFDTCKLAAVTPYFFFYISLVETNNVKTTPQPLLLSE